MTSMRRRYVASTSLRRHVPAGNLDPLAPPPPPNILNLSTPVDHYFFLHRQDFWTCTNAKTGRPQSSGMVT